MNKIDYKILFSSFVFFYTMFFKWDGLDPTWVGWIHNGLILCFLLVNIKIFALLADVKYKLINLFAILWALVIIYSAYANQGLSTDILLWNSEIGGIDVRTKTAMRLDHSIYYAIKVIMFILFFEYLNKINKVRTFLKYLFVFLLIYVIFSDINAFTYHSEGIDGYKVGTKFHVCYLNIFLVTIYIMKNNYLKLSRKQITVVRIILLVTFLLSLKTQCTTMIIGTIVYYCLFFVLKISKRPTLYKPMFYLSGLFICDILFFFLVTWILKIPLVQYIIVDILGEDLTLTGRVGMYAKLGAVLQECPLYGFGLGNSNLTTTMYEVGSNAQNGLLNMVIEIGFLGAALYLAMLLLMMKFASKHSGTYPIICFVYMMLILSSIEITFTTYFTAMIIMLMLNNQESTTYEKSRNNYCASIA